MVWLAVFGRKQGSVQWVTARGDGSSGGLGYVIDGVAQRGGWLADP